MSEVKLIPIADIMVVNRQRDDLPQIDVLALDIGQNGLLNPITVRSVVPDGMTVERAKELGHEPYRLVAGGRRLEAHRYLGEVDIEAKIVTADDERAAIMEFSENEKRVDLPWQDKVRAFKVIWNMTDQSGASLARAIGMSEMSVSRYKVVSDGFDSVKDLETFSAAHAKLAKKAERAKVREQEKLKVTTRSRLSGLEVLGGKMELRAPPADPVVPAEIKHTSFLEWAPAYNKEPFTLVHCDFPYGIGLDKSGGQTTAKRTGETYEDSIDTYFELLDCLNKNPHIFGAHCQLVFWFSMHFYRETVDCLQRDGGWRVDPFPLIWDKSPSGMLPDANRGYRRVYETALFCTKGDPKVLQPKAALARGSSANLNHPSGKNEVVLEHFLSPLVDETTRFLDPTCGSGNAVKIARRLKAEYSLGLELDEQFAHRAALNIGA